MFTLLTTEHTENTEALRARFCMKVLIYRLAEGLRDLCVLRGAILPVLILALVPAVAAAQDARPRVFSLQERASVTLSADWTERREEDVPPLNPLAAAAPDIRFSDILVLENRKRGGVVKLLFSENPYEGLSAAELDSMMHAQNGRALLSQMYYFFFPSPRVCMAQARAKLQAAVRKDDERRATEDKESRSGPSAIQIQQVCAFGTTPIDIFAEQLSPGVIVSNTARPAPLSLRSFYIAPSEQVTVAGWEFFVFQAEGQQFFARTDLDRFGLPDDLLGARAYFFWAIGAPAPFPFVRDFNRKDKELVHLVFATLSTKGTAAPAFREVLSSLQLAR